MSNTRALGSTKSWARRGSVAGSVAIALVLSGLAAQADDAVPTFDVYDELDSPNPLNAVVTSRTPVKYKANAVAMATMPTGSRFHTKSATDATSTNRDTVALLTGHTPPVPQALTTRYRSLRTARRPPRPHLVRMTARIGGTASSGHCGTGELPPFGPAGMQAPGMAADRRGVGGKFDMGGRPHRVIT